VYIVACTVEMTARWEDIPGSFWAAATDMNATKELCFYVVRAEML
jgi:hypothetical protein